MKAREPRTITFAFNPLLRKKVMVRLNAEGLVATRGRLSDLMQTMLTYFAESNDDNFRKKIIDEMVNRDDFEVIKGDTGTI